MFRFSSHWTVKRRGLPIYLGVFINFLSVKPLSLSFLHSIVEYLLLSRLFVSGLPLLKWDILAEIAFYDQIHIGNGTLRVFFLYSVSFNIIFMILLDKAQKKLYGWWDLKWGPLCYYPSAKHPWPDLMNLTYSGIKLTLFLIALYPKSGHICHLGTRVNNFTSQFILWTNSTATLKQRLGKKSPLPAFKPWSSNKYQLARAL